MDPRNKLHLRNILQEHLWSDVELCNGNSLKTVARRNVHQSSSNVSNEGRRSFHIIQFKERLRRRNRNEKRHGRQREDGRKAKRRAAHNDKNRGNRAGELKIIKR